LNKQHLNFDSLRCRPEGVVRLASRYAFDVDLLRSQQTIVTTPLQSAK
jgi:hypothetical protein